MKNLSGFTLIELMVTLAVGVVILSIGVPAFLGMMSNNQAAGYANDLVGAMRLARSEAVKRGSDVTVCASNSDQTACSGTAWNNGWIVFTDDDGSNSLGEGEMIIKVWSIQSTERESLTIRDTPTPPEAIRFAPSGANALDAEIQLAFEKTDCHASQARQITISRTGRASLDLVACF